MHSVEKISPVSEDASSSALSAASLSLNQSETCALTSIEEHSLNPSKASDGGRSLVGAKSNEDVSRRDDDVHPDHSTLEREQSCWLGDNEDLVNLATWTDEYVPFLIEDEFAEDDIVVRVDTPVTKPAAVISPTSFPGPTDAARHAVRYTESNADDQENQPPPKWSPARIARDLQLANPLYAHANPVFTQHVKPVSCTGVRVPLADVTTLVQNEIERKKIAMKGKKLAPKSALSSTSYNMRRKSNRVSVRSLR